MCLLHVFLALGPAAFFYALAYLLKNPADWTGPALLLPFNLCWIRGSSRRGLRALLIVGQVGSLATGLMVGLMTYFVLLE